MTVYLKLLEVFALDGMVDIASVNFGQEELGIPPNIVWFEKTRKDGNVQWIKHYIDYGTIQTPADMELIDIDGDGDLDVLTAAFYGHEVLWYENKLE